MVKIGVTRGYHNVQSVTQYMGRSADTLNQTAILEDVTTLNTQMNIYVTANNEIGTN